MSTSLMLVVFYTQPTNYDLHVVFDNNTKITYE